MDTLQPGTMLGRYEIRRLLGQGGMGCVYEAQHRDLKKRVAIKTLLPSLASSRDARERFLREGEAASRIRHPHVVDVTDVGSEGAVIYLVMEYLEGEDLARLIARQGHLSPAQTADIMLPVAAAIATAHEQGVIHRDLKPENIFLARAGYGGLQPKVLDFGISKVLGDSRARALTGTAATMGTMNYLPPESLRAAREADARSDQYGLGTIVYECVTGRRAFDEASFYLILNKIAEGQFAPPSSLRPDLPRRMEETILRAMSLEPARRFDSVRDLGAALLEFASEAVRGFWTPFFGGAQDPSHANQPGPPPAAIGLPSPSGSQEAPARESRGGSGSEGGPRVATLAAPSTGGAGGTIALPPPSPSKSPSTTLRNATGERASRRASSSAPARRSRAPLVVVGAMLAAAVAALALLRGADVNSQRAESSATSAEPPAPSPSPTTAAPPPTAPRPAIAPEPSAAVLEAPRPEAPGAADQKDAVAGQVGGVADELARPAKASGSRTSPQKTQKKIRTGRSNSAAPPPGTPTKPPSDVLIID